MRSAFATVVVAAIAASALGAGVAMAPSAQAATACSVTINPGTEIADVVNAQPAGATICLSSGVFKVNKMVSPKQNQTIKGSGASVLEGSAPVTNWTENGARWQAKGMLPAAYTSAGVCEDDKANLCKFAENLFVDGKQLNRVASLAAVGTGSYFADYQQNTITMGQSPVGHNVTMAKTRTAISSVASGVKLDGLTVRQFANLPQLGAVVVSGPNWTVSNSVITRNHAVGLMLAQGVSATVIGNQISSNGQLGLGQYRSNGALIEGNTIADNNTDGFWIADWESGGIKVTYSSSMIRKNTIVNNLGVGVWADVQVDGMTVDSNTITGNSADGVRYEISRNGVISNNIVSKNGLGLKRGGGTGLMSGAGIDVNTSSNVKINNNSVTGNLNGISLQARNRGTNSWGQYNLANITVTANTVDITSPSTATNGIIQAADRVFDTKAAGIGFYDNKYVVPSMGTVKFNLGRSSVPFSGWTAAGHDVTGGASLTSPTIPTTVPPSTPAPPVEPSPAPVLASDTFTRNQAQGFGAAETGGQWTVRGPAEAYARTDGYGVLTMAKPGTLSAASLNSVSSTAADTATTFTLDKAPTGGGIYVSLVGRSVAAAGDYRAKVQLKSTGTYLTLVRTTAAGVETKIGNEMLVDKTAAKAGSVYNLRLVVSGVNATTLKAKVWQGTEPAAWNVTGTDATVGLQKAGSIGILASLSGSAVNAPVSLKLDQIECVSAA